MSSDRDDDSTAWEAIVADLSADTELVDGGRRLQINDPRAPDAFIDELLAPGPLAADRFVPEEPPALQAPRDTVARFAWAGLIGGPLLSIASVAMSWGTLVTTAGFAAFVAGFATLIARREDRDDDDDGAVV